MSNTKEQKRFTVYEVGFSQGSYDTFEEAWTAAQRCWEYSYVVDNQTGERKDYGGPVSG